MLQKMFDWTYKKIDPKIQRVRGIKVRASVEPLRAESHPSTLHRGVNRSSDSRKAREEHTRRTILQCSKLRSNSAELDHL